MVHGASVNVKLSEVDVVELVGVEPIRGEEHGEHEEDRKSLSSR